MKYKRISAAIMASCIAFSNIFCFADSDKIQSNKDKIDSLQSEKENLEGQKNSVNKEILALVTDIQAKQSEIDVVQGKIDELQKEIDTTEESIVKTNENILSIEKKIKENEETYKQKEKEQKYQEDVLINRVKRNYMNETYNEFLAIILQSESLSEILFKVKYINDILKNDQLIIEDLKETKVLLAEAKAALDEDKESLADYKSSLEFQQNTLIEKQDIIKDEKASLDKQMSSLNQLEREKQAKISSINKSQNYIDNQIQDLTDENNSLSGILGDSSSSSSGDYGSGSFVNPTTGRYTSNYGPRIHPITGKQSFHSGQDIANSYGTKIVAADSGKVLRASYNGAYGNSIVIDHGNGYSTMYAHMQAFSVSSGQKVTRGQKIGEMGSTGWSTGPHLHYEVWYKGNHTNPRKYLN